VIAHFFLSLRAPPSAFLGPEALANAQGASPAP
jgi:hypothetical protein